jgi:mannose-1-phosphate guanylyltransferase/mannose-6-phosphate isomerase
MESTGSELSIVIGKLSMNQTVKRPWGEYRVVSDSIHKEDTFPFGITHIKTKILTVSPKSRLSMQRHSKRSEVWTVLRGTAVLETWHEDIETLSLRILREGDVVTIRQFEWHRLCNKMDDALTIIEVQYGSECIESDIRRIGI